MIKPVKWTLQCSLCGKVTVALPYQPKFRLTTEQYPALDKSMKKLFGRNILVKKIGIAYWVEILGAHICNDCAKTLEVAFGEIVAFDESEIRKSQDVD